MAKVHTEPARAGRGSPDRDRTTESPRRIGNDCRSVFRQSLRGATRRAEPFEHWLLERTLPASAIEALVRLPIPAPDPQPGDGTREGRNEQRRYIDPAAIARFGVCGLIAEAFQDEVTVSAIESRTGAALDGTYLRLELAQDVEGFWLAPHTDLGVKRFTLLCYLDPPGQVDLGTDLYAASGDWRSRVPFVPGGALAFVPGGDTWHGFEPRPIRDVRRSLIVNYVGEAWRAREQLAFPERPVRGAQ